MEEHELDIFAARFKEFLRDTDPKVFKVKLRTMFFEYIRHALRTEYSIDLHLFVQDIERFMFHVLEAGDYDEDI